MTHSKPTLDSNIPAPSPLQPHLLLSPSRSQAHGKGTAHAHLVLTLRKVMVRRYGLKCVPQNVYAEVLNQVALM